MVADTPPEQHRSARPEIRLRLAVRGTVQGVGFRPFVYRLAQELSLHGWVRNSAEGVVVEAEGARNAVEQFWLRLQLERPEHSWIASMESSYLDLAGHDGFRIAPSESSGRKLARILPDLAPCAECLREIFDRSNRRFGYPFTNCTHCGPRYSIMESLPYDRANTSMRPFAMCDQCRAEFEDPRDRRFHAQPNACSRCGPLLELWNADGKQEAGGSEALREAAALLRGGGIVAVKGLGGFQLMARADDAAAVQTLRERKRRAEKPFALMVCDRGAAEELVRLSPAERRLLEGSEAPIVLARRRSEAADRVASSVAPGNPYLGVMLPSTPLHHLLLREMPGAVVATSGNVSDEPICTDELEACDRLRGIADAFLVHNRAIVRALDDSVARVVHGREMVLRCARGYAPLPVAVPKLEQTSLGVGGHLKNTVAVGLQDQIVLSQHIGDLDNVEAFEAFRRASRDLAGMYELDPERIASDLHPDYLSSSHARSLDPRVVRVQHHYAHILSAMAENQLEGPVLGIAWDGTGYGEDGLIWGGEFLRATLDGFTRVASFRGFPLPGGDKAAHEPWRAALGLLYEMRGDALFSQAGWPVLQQFDARQAKVLRGALRAGLNTPRTSSVGRLFDGVAALLMDRRHTTFEGQAAMELEWLADRVPAHPRHSIVLTPGGRESRREAAWILDWAPFLQGMLEDQQGGRPAAEMAADFHEALVDALVATAERSGENAVILTGGCFQNALLLERALERLEAGGFRAYWHRRVPTNDGGISVGQAWVAGRSSGLEVAACV